MKNILLLVLVSGFFLINGCSENPEYAAQFHTVEGTVVDKFGNPIPGVSAYIGNYRLTSNADGQFQFNAIQDPYNLQIAYTNETGKKVGVEYVSLFNEKVIIGLNDISTGSNDQADVAITLPTVPANSEYMIFITDLQNFTKYFVVTASSSVITVYWKDPESVNAKVIVLVRNQVTKKYDNFASKVIVLTNGVNTSVSFASGDFNFDPEDIEISGNITPISGYSTPNSSLIFRFTDGFGYGGATLVAEMSSTLTYNYFIPGNLPVNAKYIAGAFSQGATNQYSGNTITYEPKFPIQNIPLLVPSKQSEPANNATGINYETYLTYTDGGGDGIYEVTLESGSKKFIIYTRATSLRIPNFPYEPSLAIGNENYTWDIKKYIGINNVNEFARTLLYKQKDYSGTTSSEVYNFTTQE